MSGLNERAKRQIALLAGEDLEDGQVEEARRSIELCPECRGHWVRVRGCIDVLDRVGKSAEPVPGSSLWPAIESRLRPTVVVRRPERFNGWVPALSMAAACAALLLAGQLDGIAPQETSPGAPGELMEANVGNWPRLQAWPGARRPLTSDGMAFGGSLDGAPVEFPIPGLPDSIGVEGYPPIRLYHATDR
jgi:hypothetical protein